MFCNFLWKLIRSILYDNNSLALSVGQTYLEQKRKTQGFSEKVKTTLIASL